MLYSKKYLRGGPGVCVTQLSSRQHANPPRSGMSLQGPASAQPTSLPQLKQSISKCVASGRRQEPAMIAMLPSYCVAQPHPALQHCFQAPGSSPLTPCDAGEQPQAHPCHAGTLSTFHWLMYQVFALHTADMLLQPSSCTEPGHAHSRQCARSPGAMPAVLISWTLVSLRSTEPCSAPLFMSTPGLALGQWLLHHGSCAEPVAPGWQ